VTTVKCGFATRKELSCAKIDKVLAYQINFQGIDSLQTLNTCIPVSGRFRHWGASTVKWTALDPCLGLSESDPKQYTNFEFYEIKIHKHLENI
jgi:hypothetical protein